MTSAASAGELREFEALGGLPVLRKDVEESNAPRDVLLSATEIQHAIVRAGRRLAVRITDFVGMSDAAVAMSEKRLVKSLPFLDSRTTSLPCLWSCKR